MNLLKLPSDTRLKSLTEEFICENCEDYLRPPISFCSGDTTICGTCSQLSECKDDIIGRCKILEKIGSMLKFPCRYSDDGCTLSLTWNEADHHERQCLFRQYMCPACMKKRIYWKGTAGALKIHVEIYHKKLIILEKTCDISLINGKGILFIIEGDELYVLFYECDTCNKLLWFSLKWIGPTEQVKLRHFKLSMVIPNGDGSSYFDRNQAEPADVWEIVKTSALQVDLSVLKIKLLMMYTKRVQVKLEVFCRTPVYHGCTGKDLLKDVECIVCQDFMTSSIFQCVIGHSFCGSCKPKLRDCPICRGNISDSRNFSLESICSKIKFNCFYMDDGCSFSSTLEKVILHEVDCFFGCVDCPLKSLIPTCNWRGKLNEIKVHTGTVHGITFKRPISNV